MPYPINNKQRVIKFLPALLLLCISLNTCCQVKWDGEAGDGQWISATNWAGNTVPGATDDVVLDNSLVAGNYTVSLPAGMTAVLIKSIIILPVTGNAIQLQVPVTNTAAPALTASGPGYGITIGNGGSLLNASGATSGNTIAVTDSFSIHNGGQYIHNTRSAHAALVTILSTAAGTEKGIFMFDAPGGGYTIASTGRTYGTLVLSPAASGGSQVYATSAASPLTINGDLIIKPGVTFNLDITAATTIKGIYQQEGGVFNLASQPNNNTVFIEGDFIQTAGMITETSGGLPAIELRGNSAQHIRAAGMMSNSVGLKINNAHGVNLLSDFSLPYSLVLLNGIVHNQGFLVTLQAGCGINADSLSGNSFINGALRKEGLSADAHFLFPVGKGITQRWLALKNVTGNYTVEFFKTNPNTLSFNFGTGIHHISSIEYWSVNADLAPAPVSGVELSFDNVNSGGVTDMSSLKVTQFDAGAWTDRGNTGTTGTAGSAGSVISNVLNVFGPAAAYFTLASSNAFQNPLPLQLLSFSGRYTGNAAVLQWHIAPSFQPAYFELQRAADGVAFKTLAVISRFTHQTAYQYSDTRTLAGHYYYRLKMVEAGGTAAYSHHLQVVAATQLPESIRVWPSVVSSNARLQLYAVSAGGAQITIFNVAGKTMMSMPVQIQPGLNTIALPLQAIKAGVYMVSIKHSDGQVISTRFVKTAPVF